MAKKKKTRKKARTANRLDYTKGGRVGYRPGGRVPGEPTEEEIQRNIEEREEGGTSSSFLNQVADTVQDSVTSQDSETPTPTVQTSADVETRRQELAEQAMQPVESFKPQTIGEVVGQEAMEAAVLKGEGTQIAEEDVTKVSGTLIDTPEKQAVSLIDEAPQIAAPEQIQAPTVEAVQAGVAEVDAATGEVRPEALVEKTDVTRVEPIEGAEVEIKEGAIAERLEAQMSPEAIAEAAEVSGLDVRRVTRAKEELRNAGS